jgi:hypothetical protein
MLKGYGEDKKTNYDWLSYIPAHWKFYTYHKLPKNSLSLRKNPTYMRNVSEMTNESTAKSILDETLEAYQWLLTQKP